tara:strand:+ start:71 stop:1210 length:1140 start_codon:yes stop_codon:yes gene_type:complete
MHYLTDEKLKEAIDVYNTYKTDQACADHLGIAKSTFQHRRKTAVSRGYSPEHGMDNISPEGFSVTGTSTLYDKSTGEAKIQWVKTSREKEQQELAIKAAVEAMSKEIPRVKPVPAPKMTHSELLNEYIITDYHYGALAWHKEGGADWDVKIAGDLLWRGFQRMVDSSPDASGCVIAQLGDFFHSDSMIAETPASGHPLDQDGRVSKIVAEATTVFRKVVDYALQKHDSVHVVLAEGNHDPYSSIWFRIMFKALYENEPRLTVNDSELPYYVYAHGDVMLAYHHGHKKQMGTLPLFFAAQYPKVWGNSIYRYCSTGHKHHSEVKGKESSGMICEQYQTFAARDAYASRGGWLSERSMTSITYHKKYGKAATNIFRPEMFD